MPDVDDLFTVKWEN